MIEVSIPSMHREVDETGKSRKLFRIEILFNGRKHFILRRQSDFQILHRKLKKILLTPEFPNKRTQLRSKPAEQRRQELEYYIQVILNENEAVPQELLDFLEVKHFHTANKIRGVCDEQLNNPQGQEKSCKLLHQRVVGYSCDPFLISSKSADLPDIVVAGVLQGFYPRQRNVGFKTCSKFSVRHAHRRPPIPTIIIDRCSLSSLPEVQIT